MDGRLVVVTDHAPDTSGAPEPSPARRRLVAIVAGSALAVGLVGAWALGRETRPGQDVAAPRPSSSPATPSAAATTGTPTPSASPTPSAPPTSPTAPPTKAGTPSPSAALPGSAVEAGRTTDFGFLRSATTVDGWVHLSFDRATLYRGQAANDYAAAHGLEHPVPNDYLIVNDSHQLRDLVLARSVTVTGTAQLGGGSVDPVPVSVGVLLAALAKGSLIPVDVSYDTHLQVSVLAEPFFP